MKLLKQFIFFGLTPIALMSFSQCASTQRLESKAPVNIKEVFYKEWSNPARGMGSGLNLFLVLNEENSTIELDSVYFRKKKAKIAFTKDNIYVAKFKTASNTIQPITMSLDPKEEVKNPHSKNEEPDVPFELANDECIISYKEKGKLKYFKLTGLKKRQSKRSLDVPM